MYPPLTAKATARTSGTKDVMEVYPINKGEYARYRFNLTNTWGDV